MRFQPLILIIVPSEYSHDEQYMTMSAFCQRVLAGYGNHKTSRIYASFFACRGAVNSWRIFQRFQGNNFTALTDLSLHHAPKEMPQAFTGLRHRMQHL